MSKLIIAGSPKKKKTTIKASKKGNAQFISASDNLLNMLSRQPRTNNKIVSQSVAEMHEELVSVNA
jgi:hypothetical protein